MATSSDYHQTLISNLKQLLAQLPDVENVEEIQTHISTVLLAGHFAYKIKKPLDLGFLDFSTVERRRHCSHEEIRLNGRLAPQIYLDVVEIRGSAESPQLDGDGEVIDYAVRMQRFSQDDLLSRKVAELRLETVSAIADRLVQFHREIAVAPEATEYGTPETAVFPMRQNFEQIRELVDNDEALQRLAVLESWTEERYRQLYPLMEKRKADGFIRECHGDLHLGNIAQVEGEVVIFDGIEFNPNLSWIDTISELAFLLMDLEERGRADLSNSVLNQYMQGSGDYAALPLLRFYQVYRAMVRAKISVIRLSQPDLEEAEKQAVYAAFFGYLGRAEAYTTAQAQGVVLTFGVSGAGKSTVTERLIQQLPAVRIRSDVERKRLAGLDSDGRSESGLGEGIYTAEFSARTYAHLVELTMGINAAGFIAVVDATFLKQNQRALFTDLAQLLDVPALILDFQVAEDELRRRVAARSLSGGDASEADLRVLEAQLASVEPLTAAERQLRVVINQQGDLPLSEIRARLGE
ncbi:MAG: aminoglycoside phosphotransferase [Sedimenticola sp.]|nr:MAG: aminoglycoside phosphotransferase [Sedimenticola sp.]